MWQTAVAVTIDLKPKDHAWEAWMKWDDGTNNQHDWSTVVDFSNTYFTATVKDVVTKVKISPTKPRSSLSNPAWMDGTEGDNIWPERRFGYSSFNEQPNLVAVQSEKPIPESVIQDKDKPRA